MLKTTNQTKFKKVLDDNYILWFFIKMSRDVQEGYKKKLCETPVFNKKSMF
jgi:hypothetical protein